MLTKTGDEADKGFRFVFVETLLVHVHKVIYGMALGRKHHADFGSTLASETLDDKNSVSLTV